LLNSVSSSVGVVLKPAGVEASKDIITSRYLKDPTDPAIKNDAGYKEWVAFMQKYYPDGALNDDFNVYGFSVAQTMAHVLKQCGQDLSRANVMKQAASIKDLSLPMLLPGIKINTSATDFYPIEQEQLAKFDGERWVLFGEIFDASKK
jgi:branched-chain amino acid transport system substrate-binding protein